MLNQVTAMIAWVRRIIWGIGRQMADFFSAVIAPVERLFGGVVRAAFSALEYLEWGATSGVVKLGRFLLWPFRALGR